MANDNRTLDGEKVHKLAELVRDCDKLQNEIFERETGLSCENLDTGSQDVHGSGNVQNRRV